MKNGLFYTLGLLLLAASAPAAAQNPFEAEQRELTNDVRRAGRSPRGMLPLLSLWRDSGHVRPEVALASLDAIVSDRRVSSAVRMYARGLRAQALLRMGDPRASAQATQEAGFVQHWRVIGPFDNEGKTGFAREYAPERERMGPLDLAAHYEGRERPVGWRLYPNVTRFGYVSFDAVMRPRANVCGYAETFVDSERAQPLTLWVGGGGATRVWWNGEVVHEDGAYRLPHVDRSVAMVGAHAGLNRVLVKTCVTDRRWGFYLRVANAAGDAPSGVTTRSNAPAEEIAQIQAGSGVRRLPRAPVAPFAALFAAAEGESVNAPALEDLARFLHYTGSDDPAEERAQQLARRAAEQEPTVARLALASQLSNQRGDALRFARQAMTIAPSDPVAHMLLATVISRGPSPEAALPLLDGIEPESATGMRAVLLAADLLRTLGLSETARARVEAAAARAPGAPNWVAARAQAAGSTERRDELVRLRAELTTLRYDDLGSRRVLIDDALNRGEAETMLEQLRIYRELAADQSRTYIMAAELYEAVGRMDQSFAAYRAGLEVAPEEASLFFAQGQALLRMDQRDAAAAALRQGLVLRPQDATTRELLEQLEPEERTDEAFAVNEAELLSRTQDSGGYPISVLEELTVNTVFSSGLGSRFRQSAVQIHDEEGARLWRTFPIQFDPDVQRVTVRQARVFRNGAQLSATRTFEEQLGQPWYRVYYDTRALVVVFPDLEPGDVVEIQYRLDDIAPRNLFHDYFGDLTYLRKNVPMRSFDYVLITPSDRIFHFNEPEMESLEHETREEDGQRIERFHVENVSALRSEPSMPGMTELVPYLHVSTYRTWEEVGRWYWGLIQDQLYADESIQRVVRDLVRDVTDTRERVTRIYDWVIRNTRYVALEFGIHGFLPYRVPDIANRGFGDCKDKASLIYVMLREAGIDARFVLTRTRRNGEIRDLPASLAVFDHAIAYVPELDLYLDGTAEFTGIEELPTMDQGVTVLRVGPDDVVLTRTPILAPDMNRRTRSVQMQLNADGSGRVSMTEEIRGVESPGYRSRYASEALRAERLERSSRSIFPGLELTDQTIENLDDYNANVRVRYSATAPQLAVRDGSTLRIATTILHDLSRRMARVSRRELPLDLGSPSSYVEDRTVRLPAGWHVGDLPAGGTAESGFGRLEVVIAREGRNVSAHTEFTLRRNRIPAAEYPAFRAWVEEADRILRQRLTIRQGDAQ